MENKDFKSGNYNTHFIEKNMEFLMEKQPCGDKCQDIALIAAYIHYKNHIDKVSHVSSDNGSSKGNVWKEFGRRKSLLKL